MSLGAEQRDKSDRLRRAWIDAEAAEVGQRLAEARAELGVAARAQLSWLLRFAYGEDANDTGRLSGAGAWALEAKARELVRVATDGRWESEGGGHYAFRLLDTRGDRAGWAKLPPSDRARLEYLRAENRGGVRVAVPVFTPEHAAEIRTAQAAVRGVVEAVAEGQPGFLYGGRGSPAVLTKSRASDEARLTAPPPGIATQARVYWEREGSRLAVRTTIRGRLSDALRVAAVVLISKVPITLVRRCAWKRCGRVFIGRKRQRYCAAHREIARDAARKKAQETYADKGARRSSRPRKGGHR